MQNEFNGTGVALITPMNEDLSIDYDGLLKLIKHTASGGVDYFVVNGTTGESATTNKDEKRELLRFVLDNNSKGLPVVYGTGGYDTLDIVDHISEMDWKGVAALLSVTPYYNRPSQRGVIAHYTAIADACPAPVILYNVPKRTGTDMTTETILELAQHKNIIGVKEASGDIGKIIDICEKKLNDFLVISGDDMLTVPMMSVGAIGAISVLANAFPEDMSGMVRGALEGNYEKASQFLYKLNPVNPLMYVESSPVGIKQTLELMGICRSDVRLPLVPASEQLKEKITNYLAR